jgi:lipid-binding SYLF domain-containing protein
MKNKVLLVVLMLACVLPVVGEDKEEKVDDRIMHSATVFKEILGMPDGIPKDLLNKAYCVVIYPSVKKAAFIVGASYGRGLITCRKGPDFSGSLERTGDVCAGSRERRFPDWRAGYRLCASGDE